MAFAIKEDTLIIAFIMAPIAQGGTLAPFGGDVTGCLMKWAGEDFARLHYRHRYYCPQQLDRIVWRGSEDRFSWYMAQSKPGLTDDEALATAMQSMTLIGQIAGLTGKTNPLPTEVFEVRGDFHKMIELIEAGKNPDWFHFATQPPEGPPPPDKIL